VYLTSNGVVFSSVMLNVVAQNTSIKNGILRLMILLNVEDHYQFILKMR